MYFLAVRALCLGCLVSVACGLPMSSSMDSPSSGKNISLTKNVRGADEGVEQSAIDNTSGLPRPGDAGKVDEERRQLTDSLMQNDHFAPDGTIDYDAMELNKPEHLVPDAENDTLHETELEFMQMHERAQFMRIAEIKESILSKLRLLAPPNITAMKLNNKMPRFPEHILPRSLDKMAMQSDQSPISADDDYHAKISTVIQFATEVPDEKGLDGRVTDSVAYFSIPLSVSVKNLEKAILLVFVATPDGKQGEKVTLSISSPKYPNKPLLSRGVVLSDRGHWEHIDISEQVREWAQAESENYGLVLAAMLNGENLVQLGTKAQEAAMREAVMIGDMIKRPHRTPIIKMSLNKNDARYKRSFDEVPLSCTLEDREKRCCRYKFVIDFRKMGAEFDFIIQPKRYLANYCAGNCPTYYMPNNFRATLLQTLTKNSLQRCCSPTKKEKLEILFIDDSGSLVTGKLSGMSIEKCSCS